MANRVALTLFLIASTGCQKTPLVGTWEGSLEVEGEDDLELSFEITKDDHTTDQAATLDDVEVDFLGNRLDGSGSALGGFNAFWDWEIMIFYGDDDEADYGYMFLWVDLDGDELDGEYELCGYSDGSSISCNRYGYEGDVTLERDD